MIFQVQNINKFRNNQLKSNKIYKHSLTILSILIIIYLIYYDIFYINKILNDKNYREQTIKNVKDNLLWKSFVIISFIIFVYYINFIRYKWTHKLSEKYFSNSFVNIITPIIVITNSLLYFIFIYE